MGATGMKSKKRSAASLRSQPNPPTIFLDECLGGRTIAIALRKAGFDVEIQDERSKVPRGLDDPDWAKLIAGRGWVAVTRDKRIRYRMAEKQAIADAKLALFVLASRRNLSRADIIDRVSAATPRMVSFIKKHHPPFIAKIYQDGQIKLLEKLI